MCVYIYIYEINRMYFMDDLGKPRFWKPQTQVSGNFTFRVRSYRLSYTYTSKQTCKRFALPPRFASVAVWLVSIQERETQAQPATDLGRSTWIHIRTDQLLAVFLMK